MLDAFPSATLIRPAVMFGPGDAFITPLLSMIRQMPVFPMFGAGTTRLQPAYVEDFAEAITRTLQLPLATGRCSFPSHSPCGTSSDISPNFCRIRRSPEIKLS